MDSISRGKELYNEWQSSGATKAKVAADNHMTYGQAAGLIWRYQQSLKSLNSASFSGHYKPLGKPWDMEMDDCIVAADVQLPHTQEMWIDLLCMTAQKHLKRPRKLILAGDLLNNDAFSGYEPDNELPSLKDEIDAAQSFFRQILLYFDEVSWFWGNHERRATRRTKNALTPYLMGQLVLGPLLHLGKVKLSHWGYMFLQTSRQKWVIAHGRNYSVQQLSVAEWLSWKYQRNVISFHEHHLAHGYDRYGHFQVINGGGLFDQAEMGYAMLDASKSPNMVNGFVLFKDGYPHVLGPDGFTDWSRWLPDGTAQQTTPAIRLADAA